MRFTDDQLQSATCATSTQSTRLPENKSDLTTAQIHRMRQAGHSYREIVQQVGVSPWRVLNTVEHEKFADALTLAPNAEMLEAIEYYDKFVKKGFRTETYTAEGGWVRCV